MPVICSLYITVICRDRHRRCPQAVQGQDSAQAGGGVRRHHLHRKGGHVQHQEGAHYHLPQTEGAA